MFWAVKEVFRFSTNIRLNKVFDVRASEKAPFRYLGFDLSQDANLVTMDLSNVEDLQMIALPKHYLVFAEYAQRVLRGVWENYNGYLCTIALI